MANCKWEKTKSLLTKVGLPPKTIAHKDSGKYLSLRIDVEDFRLHTRAETQSERRQPTHRRRGRRG